MITRKLNITGIALTATLIMTLVMGRAVAETSTSNSDKSSEKLAKIALPKPQTSGGMPLMDALKNRESSRAFSEKALSKQLLSNLLWAAFGINRADGKRTAPSAMNCQEIEIYVALPEGLFVYNPQENALDPVLNKDIREFTGVQEFTQQAPVNLIYVADLTKMERMKNHDMRTFYYGADTGFISQNVYLFCASEKLATVVLGWVNKPELERIIGLPKSKKVVLTQPIGYPSN